MSAEHTDNAVSDSLVSAPDAAVDAVGIVGYIVVGIKLMMLLLLMLMLQ